MLYLLAIVAPPLAVLIAGKLHQVPINILLCLLLIVPGIIHAFKVVSNHYDGTGN